MLSQVTPLTLSTETAPVGAAQTLCPARDKPCFLLSLPSSNACLGGCLLGSRCPHPRRQNTAAAKQCS